LFDVPLITQVLFQRIHVHERLTSSTTTVSTHACIHTQNIDTFPLCSWI